MIISVGKCCGNKRLADRRNDHSDFSVLSGTMSEVEEHRTSDTVSEPAFPLEIFSRILCFAGTYSLLRRMRAAVPEFWHAFRSTPTAIVTSVGYNELGDGLSAMLSVLRYHSGEGLDPVPPKRVQDLKESELRSMLLLNSSTGVVKMAEVYFYS